MERVAVTGGNRTLGRAVLDHLHDHGFETVNANRGRRGSLRAAGHQSLVSSARAHELLGWEPDVSWRDLILSDVPS